jgi:Icc-related predicted phosphoesterase
MRILCIADLHGEARRLEQLRPEMDRADLLLIAGDLTDFGGRKDLDPLLAILSGSPVPIAAVAGNCDRLGVGKGLEEAGLSVDGGARTFPIGLGKVGVIGSGGAILRSGMTPNEKKEADLASALENGLRSLEPQASVALPLIVLTHNPPWGCQTDLRYGEHVGSRALRQFLEAKAPSLWISGHIHESRAAGVCGPTMVVNPGPLHDGYYALVYLEEAAGSMPRAELLCLPHREN